MSLLAYDRILHALSGLYIWEWIQSCSDDRKYLTSSKRSWAMTFNFVNRYLLLFGIIASLAEFDISQSESTNCRAWHTATLTFLLGSIVLANLAFALKVITAWNRRNYITVPIIVLFIGTTMFFFAYIPFGEHEFGRSAGLGCNRVSPSSASFFFGAFLSSTSFTCVLLVLLLVRYATSARGIIPQHQPWEILYLALTTAINGTFCILLRSGSVKPEVITPITILCSAVTSTISASRMTSIEDDDVVSRNAADVASVTTDGTSRPLAPSQSFMKDYMSPFRRNLGRKDPPFRNARYSTDKPFRRLSSLPSMTGSRPASGPSSIDIPISIAPPPSSSGSRTSCTPSTQAEYPVGGSMIYGDVYDEEAKI